jgi:hypothetical protein
MVKVLLQSVPASLPGGTDLASKPGRQACALQLFKALFYLNNHRASVNLKHYTITLFMNAI